MTSNTVFIPYMREVKDLFFWSIIICYDSWSIRRKIEVRLGGWIVAKILRKNLRFTYKMKNRCLKDKILIFNPALFK